MFEFSTNFLVDPIAGLVSMLFARVQELLDVISGLFGAIPWGI